MMKLRIFAVIILCTNIINFSYAQSLETSLSFGGSLSSVKYVDPAAWEAIKPYLKPKLGYTLDLSLEYLFSPVLGIRTQVAYTQKGFAYEYTYRQGWKRFNYLDISTQAHFYFVFLPSVEISAYMGAFGGYWLSGYKFEADYRGSLLLGEKIDFSDTTFAYNRLEAGPVAGFRVKYWQTGSQAISLDLGMQYSTVSNDRQNVAGTKNRSLLLTIGYMWVIK